MMHLLLPLLPIPGGGWKEAAGNVVKDWLIDLAGKSGASAQLMVEKTGTFWVTGVDTPQLTVATAGNPYTPANTIAFLWAHLHFYVAGLAVFSILIGAIKMVWERNGQPGRELALSLLQLVIISTAGLAVIALLINVSDEFAAWILKDASRNPNGTYTTFQVAYGAMFNVNPGITGTNAIAIILLMQLLFWLSLLQIILLIIRGGMLFLLAGILPFAAAAGNTQIGRQWLQRSIAWLLAFILYKPVAAIVYATGFQLTREGGTLSASDAILKIITGLTLCMLAIFALPALMRFTVPAVAATAGGSSTAGIAALGGGIAAGAKAVGNQSGGQVSSGSSSSQSSGGGGSGGGSQDGPSGNTGTSSQSGQSGQSSQSGSTGPSGSAESTGSTESAGTSGSESASGSASSGSAGSGAGSSSSGSAGASGGGGGGVPAAAGVAAIAEKIKQAAAAPAKTTSNASGEGSGASGAAPSNGSTAGSGGSSSGSSSGSSGSGGPSGSGPQKPKQ